MSPRAQSFLAAGGMRALQPSLRSAAGSTVPAATSTAAVMSPMVTPRGSKRPSLKVDLPEPPAVGEGAEEHQPAADVGDDLPAHPSWGDPRLQALRKRQEELQQQQGVSLDGVTLGAWDAQEEGVWIKPVQGEVAHFAQDGVVLANGEHLAADLVLCCTGYKKTYSYFDGAVLVSGLTGRVCVERGPAPRLIWWRRSLCVLSCACSSPHVVILLMLTDRTIGVLHTPTQLPAATFRLLPHTGVS